MKTKYQQRFIGLNLSNELYRKVKEQAQAEERPLSSMVRVMLERQLLRIRDNKAIGGGE